MLEYPQTFIISDQQCWVCSRWAGEYLLLYTLSEIKSPLSITHNKKIEEKKYIVERKIMWSQLLFLVSLHFGFFLGMVFHQQTAVPAFIAEMSALSYLHVALKKKPQTSKTMKR